jgi:predicted DCC family thiol-disulfide oxidoreductase YuxK
MYANGKDISYDSVIYQRGNSFYIKSKAILEILKDLGGGWKLLLVFGIFPKTLLDRIYDYIASHRYRWFGKEEQCPLPTPELKSRFLE